MTTNAPRIARAKAPKLTCDLCGRELLSKGGACHKCGSPLLMHQRECGLCGADCRTDDEIAEDLAIERDRERWEEEREYSDRELADKWPGSY